MALQTIRLHVVTLRRETAEAHTPQSPDRAKESVSSALIYPPKTKHTDQYANMSEYLT